MSTSSNIDAGFGKPVLAKTDDKGRLMRELRCLHCRYWFGDEYIVKGRLRLRCPRSRCGRITVMEFRPLKKSDGREPSKQLTEETKSDG